MIQMNHTRSTRKKDWRFLRIKGYSNQGGNGNVHFSFNNRLLNITLLKIQFYKVH